MSVEGGIVEWKSAVLKEIWAENTAARDALCEQVKGLTEAQLAFRPAPDKWSI